MKRVAIVLVLAACGTDTGMTGGDDSGSGSGSGSGTVTEVSGTISANATWSDTIHITGATTIAKLVTVTVNPGTTIQVDKNITIAVQGTLDIQGAKGQEVHLTATLAPDFYFNELNVPVGGAIRATYLIASYGAITVAGGAFTATDSQFSHAGGDFLTAANGTIDVAYSSFGLEPGMPDNTHCDMHFSGAAVSLKVTHSNVSTSGFGVMFYGGTNADFRYDNWFSNTYDIDVLAAYPVTGDFSAGWFAKGAPSKPGVTAANLSSTRLTDAGPR